MTMLKKTVILIMLFAFCYCVDNNNSSVLVGETRAKKKRNPVRLLTLILLLIFSKVAIFKVASFFMLIAFFQKLFSLGGILLTVLMKNATSPPGPPAPPVAAPAQPQPTYGAPQEYNTVGYSYGPPDHEPLLGSDKPLPSIADFSGTFNWLLNKP